MTGWLKETFVERFWLRRAERTAQSYAPEQHEKLRRLERAARGRTSAAAALRSPNDNGTAFALLREAFALSVTAVLVGRGEHDGESALDIAGAWQRLAAIASSLPRGPDVAALEPLLSSNDALVPDRLEPADALRLRPIFERALAWLDGQTELRSVRAIKLLRVLRATGVVVAFAASITGAVIRLHAPTATPSEPAALPFRAPRTLSRPGH